MDEDGQFECENITCGPDEDPRVDKYPKLFLLMYSGGVGHSVTIKDTTFSTHKVFNETYARLRVYDESLEDCNITF
jgi:hypothetical protein